MIDITNPQKRSIYQTSITGGTGKYSYTTQAPG